MSVPRYKVETVAEALRKSRGLVSVAARQLGCEPNTVRNYMKRHPSLQAIVEEQRDRLVDSAELRLVEAIEQKGEPWAVAFALKTLGKDRGYAPKTEQQTDHRLVDKDGADVSLAALMGIPVLVQVVDGRDPFSRTAPDTG